MIFYNYAHHLNKRIFSNYAVFHFIRSGALISAGGGMSYMMNYYPTGDKEPLYPIPRLKNI